MKKLIKTITILTLLFTVSITSIYASPPHCEVPCGIFDDKARITLLFEHLTTIEKAMKNIVEMSNQEKPDYNQLIRWVNTKEEHANKIQEIVSQYFLHQRVKIKAEANKPDYEIYIEQLKTLHAVLVYTMKTKQSTNFDNITKVRQNIKAFEKVYFHKH